MNAKMNHVKRTPFFGKYILETMGSRIEKGNMKDRKKDNLRMQQIFEMIDDYGEHA